MNNSLRNPLKPQHSLEAIIFDKDGTLVDLNSTWGHATALAIEEVCTDEEQTRLLATLLGIDLDTRKFRKDSTFPSSDVHRIIEIVATVTDPVKFGQVAREHALEDLQPTEGAGELLKDLHTLGYKLALATNDGAESAGKFLQLLGWDSYFDQVVGFDSGYGSKPSSAMIHACMETLGATPETSVMIGDTTADLQASQNAGVCYIQLGKINSEEFGMPDFQIESLNEVIPLLTGSS